MIKLHIIKILGIAGLIIALAIMASTAHQPQLQAMPSDVGEQSQVMEEEVSPKDKTTATITITMTTAPNSLMKQD